MESILTSIKKLLGIDGEYKHFDPELIILINSEFMTLNQLGVGPKELVSVKDEMTTWKKTFGEDSNLIEAVKTYIYIKVKLVFDPPTSSSVLDALKRKADELEWRLTNN